MHKPRRWASEKMPTVAVGGASTRPADVFLAFSAGEHRARALGVHGVLWLEDDFVGFGVDLEHAGELEWNLADDAQDHGAVRFDPHHVDADVPEAERILAGGRRK